METVAEAARIASPQTGCGSLSDLLAVSHTSRPDSALSTRRRPCQPRSCRAVGYAQHRGHRVGHRGGIGGLRQVEKQDPVGTSSARCAATLPPTGLADHALPRSGVTTGCDLTAVVIGVDFGSRPIQLRGRRTQGSWSRIERPQQWRKLSAESRRSYVKYPNRALSVHPQQPSGPPPDPEDQPRSASGCRMGRPV